MKRTDTILVYMDKNSRLMCRIGVGISDETPCNEICHLIKNYIHTCCSYGYINGTVQISKKFNFNNKEHEIILSSDKCSLCTNCSDGISRCRYNIQKYIDAFLKQVDKIVEIE